MLLELILVPLIFCGFGEMMVIDKEHGNMNSTELMKRWLIQRQQLLESGNVVDIKVFGESQCPDTTRFMTKHLVPLWQQFGYSGRLNISYHPFGIWRSTACEPSGFGDYNCKCQHGPWECTTNALQACIIDALPETRDHIETVACIQHKKTMESALECIQKTGNAGVLNPDEMANCALSPRGRRLMAEHGKHQLQSAPALDWVPWIVINGRRERSAEYYVLNVLCRDYLQPRPQECYQ